MAKKISKTPKKTKKTSSKSITKKTSKTKGKKPQNESTDASIVIIEDDIKIDKSAELEARRLYLEEARSQESSSSD